MLVDSRAVVEDIWRRWATERGYDPAPYLRVAHGRRIGETLARFAAGHLEQRVDAKTVVVILSDGLDRGEPEVLSGALRLIGRRARRIVWLNPLLGDPRYEPTARGMQAALPWIDRFLPAHDLKSLERVLPHLAA